MKKYINSKNIIIAVCFTIILVSGIAVKMDILPMIPLFVSLAVMTLQAKANRYGYLLGGLNACLYGIVDISYGVYASAGSAFLISFPMQLITFMNWNKNSYKKSVVFKKMSAKVRMIAGGIFVLAWIVLFAVLKMAGSEYAILDNTSTLLGFGVTILTMLAYVEYSYIWLVSGVVSALLNVQIIFNDITRLPYLVYSLYSYYCIILAFINVRKLYKEQNS